MTVLQLIALFMTKCSNCNYVYSKDFVQLVYHNTRISIRVTLIGQYNLIVLCVIVL